MRVGVVLLNFGVPENPTLDNVTTFLELIFQSGNLSQTIFFNGLKWLSNLAIAVFF